MLVGSELAETKMPVQCSTHFLQLLPPPMQLNLSELHTFFKEAVNPSKVIPPNLPLPRWIQ